MINISAYKIADIADIVAILIFLVRIIIIGAIITCGANIVAVGIVEGRVRLTPWQGP